MLQKLINFAVLVAAELDIFLEGKIARTAGFFGGMKSSDSFEPDTVKLFTRLICWHGRRNNTTTEMQRNGTLVLRKTLSFLRLSLDWNRFRPYSVEGRDAAMLFTPLRCSGALLRA
ncbi:MAG: hypothetical protein WCC03_14590 [Candidatus Acidiferrales bacterium]